MLTQEQQQIIEAGINNYRFAEIAARANCDISQVRQYAPVVQSRRELARLEAVKAANTAAARQREQARWAEEAISKFRSGEAELNEGEKDWVVERAALRFKARNRIVRKRNIRFRNSGYGYGSDTVYICKLSSIRDEFGRKYAPVTVETFSEAATLKSVRFLGRVKGGVVTPQLHISTHVSLSKRGR
jgi:hypothetical protein